MKSSVSRLRRVAAAILLFPTLTVAGPLVRHDLSVRLEPAAGRLSVSDRITLPAAGRDDGGLEFALHAGLSPHTETPGARLERVGAVQGAVPLELFRLRPPAGSDRVTLSYAGTLSHRLDSRNEGIGRRREETAGHIGADGVFLAGSSGWYPQFSDDERLLSRLAVTLPAGWRAVSQGAGSGGNRWQADRPQEDIYLIAGPYHRYTKEGTVAQAQVYLREADPELARRYLDATDGYLAYYSRLIGPYVYPKFALVENFWESGYGMPSFTLLGPQVIRLPFIVHTSYPHEILHNWWGNGVYVDYDHGNWSEGLTVCLADQRLAQRAGHGAEYRRGALQKYAEYVHGHDDFPLGRFTARHGEASQAIGYGKGMMLFHMLRERLGDRAFIAGLRRFYKDNRFRTASFDDIRRAFEAVSGEPLKGFFDQWVGRTGAPALALGRVEAKPRGQGFVLHARIRQTQEAAPYRLRLPVVVRFADGSQLESSLAMRKREVDLDLSLKKRPVRLAVDPRFDLFRRLAPGELPPSLDRVFAGRPLLVLPSAAPPTLRDGYRRLAQSWAESGAQVVWDEDLKRLPERGAVWLFGWDNRFRGRLAAALGKKVIEGGKVVLDGRQLDRGEDSVVLAAGDGGLSLAWLGSDNSAALPGLARKLPHYGKYGYLAFTGDAPSIALKGQWPVRDSPLSVALEPGAPPLRLAPRAPLESD